MADARSASGTVRRLGVLRDRHVLVVEDEYLLAVELRSWLVGEGAVVIGPVPRVDSALELLDCSPGLSLAILDINLQGRMVWPVADALLDRQIPFVFVTGYDAAVIPSAYAQVLRAEKPVDLRRLSRLLRSALD